MNNDQLKLERHDRDVIYMIMIVFKFMLETLCVMRPSFKHRLCAI